MKTVEGTEKRNNPKNYAKELGAMRSSALFLAVRGKAHDPEQGSAVDGP